MKAINKQHKSRKPHPTQPQPLQHFVSMKELAFEKLKKQQLIEQDLKQTFNLHNQANSCQLNQNVKLKSNGKLKCAIYNNVFILFLNV